MADTKLARLPDRKPVKLTIEIMPDLEQALADYAAAYEAAYVDEASGALCRPADFFGHTREWRTTAIRGFD